MRTYQGFHSLLILALLTGLTLEFPEHRASVWSFFQGEQSQEYREGKEAIDSGDWQKAIEAFSRVSASDPRADAALYWIAYAHNKMGNASEALDNLSELRDRFPDSRWVGDADALEMEITGPSSTSRSRSRSRSSSRSSSRSRSSEVDEDMELKLMALNSLMHADEDEAIPLLEEILRGDQPTKLKERALFVLAQSGSNRANEIVVGVARDNQNPDLQTKAIRYLGIHGNGESMRLLAELYETLESTESRKSVLHAFMIGDEKDRLLEVAKNEQNPELRGSAIHWLGTMDADDALWELYGTESSMDIKKKILHALFIGDGIDRLTAVAQDRSQPEELRLQAIHWLGVSDGGEELWEIFQTETSLEVKKRILHGLFLSDDTEKLNLVARDTSQPLELRKAAIHNLGISDDGSRTQLLEMYSQESEIALKKQVLHALFIQGAATELIDIARKESDRELKKQAVHWLSLIDSDEAKAYLLELLKN
jgi:tetratricopeptide (TPR) repeat protein